MTADRHPGLQGPGVTTRPDASRTSAATPLRVRWLGRVPYREALAVQQSLFDHGSGQHLLLLEHPHVFTYGRTADLAGNLRCEPAAVGAELVPVKRGGDITYHGPGQLVGYPHLDLRRRNRDLHRYLRDHEAVLIETAAAFGLNSGRIALFAG